MNKRNVRWLFGAAVGASAVLCAAAADEPEATGVKLGPGLRLDSGIGGEARYVDNMYYSPAGEVSAYGFILTPEVALSYALPSADYALGYKGEWAEYDISSEDDYQDSEIFLTGNIALLSKHRLEFDARYERGHDAFGTNRTQASPFANQKLDIWDRTGVHGRYTFGAPDAAMNAYLRGGVGSVEYRTNRTNIVNPAAGTRFLDNDTDTIGGGVSYKISPKTRLLLDYEHNEIEYDTPSTPPFDGELDRALFGVRWAATAKTTGELWVGHFSRDFDSPARRDISGPDWKARIQWDPKVRTKFTLETGRILNESYLLGENFITSEYVNLGWRQDWAPRIHTQVELGIAQDVYEGTTRDDDRALFGTRLGYELSKQWTAEAGFKLNDRNSSISAFDYDRNIIFVGIDGTF